MKRNWLTALVLSAGLAATALTSSAFAEITGKVTFDGTPPAAKPMPGVAADPNCGKMHKTPLMDESIVAAKTGELANVVIYLKGDIKGEAAADEVVLDQVGCQYVPHVVSVTVGQKLVATNGDAFLHNVHTLPENNPPKNIAQAVKGQKDTLPTKEAETFKVKCDVHPWMSAWVAIFPHPFHGVTGEDGIFSIDTKGLKDGEYEVAAWHEKFKECGVGKVTVKDGKGTVDFKVKPKTAAAPAGEKLPGEKEVMLASTEAAKPTCCTDGSKCATKTDAVAAAPAQK